MARLTLSEQLSAAQETIAKLQAEAAQDKHLLTQCTGSLELLRSQLAALRDDAGKLAETREKLAAVEKELATSKSSCTYVTSERTRAEGELEQAHAVLDGVEGAPARDYEMEYGKGKRNVVTRLAGAFLAIAKNGGAK